MKPVKHWIKTIILVTIIANTETMFGQQGLSGSWKYISQEGEMIMQINPGTIIINNQSFPFKVEGNVLFINEGTITTPYPFMLDGNRLTIEFPGGTEIVFTKAETTGNQVQGQLPQSMSKPSVSAFQEPKSFPLSGRWIFQNQQGQLILEFISANQLTFNGESVQYQLKDNAIQVMGDFGWIDYPFTTEKDLLTITFPDGSVIPFSRASSSAMVQQEPDRQSGGGSAWQLRGTLCSWSGSSNNYSSYSRSQKIFFDGQGNFQFGSESSFSSGAGQAYSGNPGETGTYSVGESTVTLKFGSGEIYQVKINMRQDNGMITELMYGETLYATGLCE